MNLDRLDWLVIILFFLFMIVIGVWSFFKNQDSSDYFVAGGKLPWWLAGISHHVSGYSGAVFVAYAGLAYTHGFSIYVWWAFTIGIAVIATLNVFPVRWVRLRKKYNIQSPLEYIKVRYNLPTQQIMAWSGVLLKLFDMGAKWAAIAILLKVFTGMSLWSGILLAGGASLVYITIGGLWAVILTDFFQFVVQTIAGIVMFIVAVMKLGGISSIFGIWDQLPEKNSQLFNEPYTFGFALTFLFINTLSYNGGTWSLATRYISSPNEKETKRAGMLSGVLYLIWPLILFFPMWAAPILLPDLAEPTESYAQLTLHLLPSGLVGLVIASMFANTMSMTSSDANTIAAVITRDMLPVLFKNSPAITDQKQSLKVARISTFIFLLFTIIIALQYQHFGGVLGLIVSWYGAMIGPIAVPMLLGMLPTFKKCDSKGAILSIFSGFGMFFIAKSIDISYALEISLPMITTAIIYISSGIIRAKAETSSAVNELFE